MADFYNFQKESSCGLLLCEVIIFLKVVNIRNFKLTSMQRWQFPIYNGNLISFVWSGMILISMFIIVKTDYFQFWILYKRDLRISFYLKTFLNFQNWTVLNDTIFHNYRLNKYFKGTVVNRSLPSLHKGSLGITHTVPSIPLDTETLIDKSGTTYY